MGTRKIIDIDLKMMLIISRNRAVGFTEEQILPVTGRDAGKTTLRIFQRRCLCAHDLRIKTSDSVGCSLRHVEFHVRDTELHQAETLIGRIATDAVAPWTGRLNVTVPLMTLEAGARQSLAYAPKAPRQRFIIRHHHADMAAQYLRLRGGQMELLASDVDPHVGRAGHHIRITRQAKPGNIE